MLIFVRGRTVAGLLPPPHLARGLISPAMLSFIAGQMEGDRAEPPGRDGRLWHL